MRTSAGSGALVTAVALSGLAVVGAAGCGPAGAERGEFVRIEADGDTTAVERYTARPGRLEGELRMGPDAANRARATYAVELDEAGIATRAVVTVWRAGARRGDPPLHRWTATFRADTAFEVVRSAGLEEERATPAPRGVVPYFAPSVALHQLVLRAAVPASAGEAAVYVLGARDPVRAAAVERPSPDSARAELDGARLRLRLDETGRILDGAAENPEYRIARVR